MKAIAVKPGTPGTVHLTELEKPKIGDVDSGRGVLVQVLQCGVDGTDKEINDATEKGLLLSLLASSGP